MRYSLLFPSLSLLFINSVSAEPTDATSNEEPSNLMQQITVTGTREPEPRSKETATTGVIQEQEIQETRPGHPSEIMERISGVHVNVTGGEGHMTAIRQPITTKPVYLYLEDGIPTRSTGFFNHNALYEINLPQAGGVEVTKGPSTALYGSDAIGGVINVLTPQPPLARQTDITLEGGEHGWGHLLASTGNSGDYNGWRGDLNITHSDGWRDATEYDRYSASARWDHTTASGGFFKTTLSGSTIDQQTAGSSRLSEEDYLNNPTMNYTPISYRKVDAVRMSSAYEREQGTGLTSVTPYFRYNTMELLPNWSLSYDPSVYETKNYSLGALLKQRNDLKSINTRLIAGLDLDYSPGSRYEQQVAPVKDGAIYVDYSIGDTLYDYDVTFMGLAPYIQADYAPTKKLNINVGLRYDYMEYDYENNLSVVESGNHRRPASTKVDYSHLSPKLGLSYQFTPKFSSFISYRHAFRAPSESQLFRQGRAVNTVDLKPVKSDSYEAGIRGRVANHLSYELSLYHMTLTDDILTYQYPDNTRETMNAGETSHRGVEVTLSTPMEKLFSAAVNYSYSKHTYEEWQPNDNVNYSGNEMSAAPRDIANTRFAYRPAFLNKGRIELEWVHLGHYWMDDANTHQYDGHDLLNLRANYFINPTWELFARLLNVTDERYATYASYSARSNSEYAPGAPRTVYAGVSAKF
ncbi:TonB-dependent receptor [Kaarinaea lacus]